MEKTDFPKKSLVVSIRFVAVFSDFSGRGDRGFHEYMKMVTVFFLVENLPDEEMCQSGKQVFSGETGKNLFICRGE